MQRALLLLRLVIHDLGLFHLLYRDEKLNIFDLSTEVQSTSRTMQCDKEGTHALLDLTTLVKPLHFPLEIVISLLHSLELVAFAGQELFASNGTLVASTLERS
jgi:hypothetical protein